MPEHVQVEGYGIVPPMREHVDVYAAHDLVNAIIDNRLNPGVVGMGVNYNGLVSKAEVLCWVLHHDIRTDFMDQLTFYSKQLRAFTQFDYTFIDQRRYTGGQRR